MQEDDTSKVYKLKEDETIVTFADPGKFAFSSEMKCDTLTVVGSDGHTLMVITPEGKILLGEDQLPLDKLLEGLRNAIAAIEMLRDCYTTKK